MMTEITTLPLPVPDGYLKGIACAAIYEVVVKKGAWVFECNAADILHVYGSSENLAELNRYAAPFGLRFVFITNNILNKTVVNIALRPIPLT